LSATTAGSKAAALTPDICVIGAGPAGLALATAAAAFGVSVVLIERDRMGGTGLNAGGAALRALVAAGARAVAVRQAGRFGVVTGEPEIAYAQVHDHVQRVIAAGAPDASVERLGALGIVVLKGQAHFTSRSTVTVEGQAIKARRFAIATGAGPAPPALQGLDTISPLTPEALFALTKRPERLLVLDGGPYGTAMAQAMVRLGSAVTLVASDGLLPRHDAEAVAIIRRALLRDGVVLHEGAAVQRAEAIRGGVRLVLAGSEATGETTLQGSHLLCADQRKPDLAGLDLELGGIRFGDDGVEVNRHLRTANSRVFAIGDCVAGAGGGAHVATRQAGLVLRSALFRLPVRQDEETPSVVHSRPELAAVGLQEAQARAKAGKITVLRWPFSETDAARAEGETAGFVKILADRKGLILGVTIVGAHASELITPWGLALRRKLKVQDMAELVPPQPSFSEAWRQASASIYAPLAARPRLRRLIGFLRRFG
jgi:pyruvate/2-oxoglutarate dehydrogenase complex dihydrolipoamide dehydrogenase (E3) component